MHFVDFILYSIPLLVHFYAEKYLQDDYTKTLQALESEFNVPIPTTYDFIVGKEPALLQPTKSYPSYPIFV